jgi:hypothetical protein
MEAKQQHQPPFMEEQAALSKVKIEIDVAEEPADDKSGQLQTWGM